MYCLAGLDHCLDYMRQVVLCHADVDMIYWYAGSLMIWKERRLTGYTKVESQLYHIQ